MYKFCHNISDETIKTIISSPDDTVIILGLAEATPYFKNLRQPSIDALGKYISQYENSDVKPDIRILTCGNDYPEHCPYIFKHHMYYEGQYYLPPWTKVVSFNTWYFYNTFDEYLHWAIQKSQYGTMWCLDLMKSDTFVPDKLYSSFIHRPTKTNRLCLMKILLDRNVLSKGEVRFANNERVWQEFLNTEHHKGFAIFNDLKHQVTQHAPSLLGPFKFWEDSETSSWGLDPSYMRGLFDLVCETDTNLNFFSEKCIRPLIFGKPFVILGTPNHNTSLEKLGFSIYRGMFNIKTEQDSLTFKDSKPIEILEHYDKLLFPLWDIDSSRLALRELYELTLNQTFFNQNRAVKICFDDSLIPEEFLLNNCWYNNIKATRSHIGSDNFFRKFVPKDRVI